LQKLSKKMIPKAIQENIKNTSLFGHNSYLMVI
jgi:hypothetical protein